ncbi:MAG: DUF1294 domain-containing protein [Sarcina sp.]
MQELIGYYLIIINIIAFILMYVDKEKAIRHQWRIKESTLMGFTIFGGSIGAFLGMQLFRHKTKHPKFYIGIPIILFIQLLFTYYIYFEIL